MTNSNNQQNAKKITEETQGLYYSDIEPKIQALIKQDHPQVQDDSYFLFQDILDYRIKHIEQQINSEAKNVEELNQDIIDSVRNGDFISPSTLRDVKPPTFGAKMADSIAKFGGSWTFILSFIGFLILWIILNATQVLFQAFDVYPFILLNLFLSCLAAIQAPIVMMSQNRQAEKDRQQSKNDYTVNLKSEIELRLLHEKMDHLLNDQMKHFQEIQQIQTEMLNRLQGEIDYVKTTNMEAQT